MGVVVWRATQRAIGQRRLLGVCGNDLPDGAGAIGQSAALGGEDVDFAVGIFTEGEDVHAEFVVRVGGHGKAAERPVARGVIGGSGRQKEMAIGHRELTAPVAEDVFAGEMGQGAASVDIATGDTDSVSRLGFGECVEIVVFEDGLRESGAVGGSGDFGGVDVGGVLGIEGVAAFALVPAVVTAFADDIDLFESALADIGGEELAGATAVEGNAPGVADTPGVDFGACGGFADQGIVGGDAVGAFGGGLVDVDAEDFAEEGGEVLSVAGGAAVEALVVGIAAIADGDVEEAIGAEGDAAAVMIEVGLIDLEEEAFGGWVDVAEVGGDDELADVAGVVPIRGAGGAAESAVVREDAAVFGEAGVEGESEEPTFIETLVQSGEPGADVKEGVWATGSIGLDDMNEADLVTDEESFGVEGKEVERGDEAVGDFAEGLAAFLGGRTPGGEEGEGEWQEAAWTENPGLGQGRHGEGG